MIDEKKLIEAIMRDVIITTEEAFDLRNEIVELIDEQPQADKWIPCEERLPECEWGCESEELMYQLKDTDFIEVGYYGEGGRYRDKYFRTYRDCFEGVDASDVIAWQPLPAPYKKEGAE